MRTILSAVLVLFMFGSAAYAAQPCCEENAPCCDNGPCCDE